MPFRTVVFGQQTFVFALVGMAIFTGCASPDPEPSAANRAMGIKPMAVQPAWRKFVMDNVDGYVYAELKAHPDIRLVGDPDISATRSVSGGPVMLMANGKVEADRVTGERYRRTYYIIWRQAGGGWDHVRTSVDAGKPAPKLDKMPKSPSTPSSQPATNPA